MVERQLKLIDEDPEQSCKRCSLHKTRNNIVWIRGTLDKNVDILFIGEAPGRDEDLIGRPFVGRAGKILDKWIQEAGIQSYAIVNIVKCRPPKNRPPTQSEIGACLPHLTKQIHELRPKLLIALGKTAMSVLINRTEVIANLGKVFQTKYGRIIVFPHPAYILRGADAYIPIKELKDTLIKMKNVRGGEA